MRFYLVASGSKGNCCVIQHLDTKIVIDCGSTKRYLSSCFQEIAFDYQTSDALLITHTHSDHVKQLKMFHDTPTYSSVHLDTNNLYLVSPFEDFVIKDLQIKVIPLSHDSENTIGFVISCDQEKLVYITDTGYIKEEVKPYLKDADYYIFESNHDIEMLMQTTRPYFTKQRIISDSGHLCNEDSAKILCELINKDKTKEIVLAHISQEGNTREKALTCLIDTMKQKQIDASKMKVYPAAQFEIYSGGSHD